LYYYYKHLLGLYKKNNVPHKLTEEMRKDIAKMDHYSELIRFLCKYKLEIAQNIDDLKDKKLREKQEILNTRNRLYYKRGNIENESEKDQITKQIIQELKKIKKEIKMCDEIVDNTAKMKEQIRQVEEKEQEKVQKKKVRRYEL